MLLNLIKQPKRALNRPEASSRSSPVSLLVLTFPVLNPIPVLTVLQESAEQGRIPEGLSSAALYSPVVSSRVDASQLLLARHTAH